MKFFVRTSVEKRLNQGITWLSNQVIDYYWLPGITYLDNLFFLFFFYGQKVNIWNWSDFLSKTMHQINQNIVIVQKLKVIKYPAHLRIVAHYFIKLWESVRAQEL